METLTVQIPDNLSEYFLEFSSKEEYLKKRTEWREIYKWLTKAIRHNKNAFKIELKTRHKILNRMHKKGWDDMHISHCKSRLTVYSWISVKRKEENKEFYDEYHSRCDAALTSTPDKVSLHGLDATELLEIRAKMKVESSKQREASLSCKS